MLRRVVAATLVVALAQGAAMADHTGTPMWAAEHIGGGAVLASAGYGAGWALTRRVLPALLVGVGAVVLVGAAKEIRDAAVWHDPATKSLGDFGANLCGAAVGVGISLGVTYAVRRKAWP